MKENTNIKINKTRQIIENIKKNTECSSDISFRKIKFDSEDIHMQKQWFQQI